MVHEVALLPPQTHLLLLLHDAAGWGEVDDLVLQIFGEVADPVQVVQRGLEQDALWRFGLLGQHPLGYQLFQT